MCCFCCQVWWMHQIMEIAVVYGYGTVVRNSAGGGDLYDQSLASQPNPRFEYCWHLCSWPLLLSKKEFHLERFLSRRPPRKNHLDQNVSLTANDVPWAWDNRYMYRFSSSNIPHNWHSCCVTCCWLCVAILICMAYGWLYVACGWACEIPCSVDTFSTG